MTEIMPVPRNCYFTVLRPPSIPRGCVEIGDRAFLSSEIEKLTISEFSINTIGKLAFAEHHLTFCYIPSSVKYIGESAFSTSHHFTAYVLPISVETIEFYAFSGQNTIYIADPDLSTGTGFPKGWKEVMAGMADHTSWHGEKYTNYFRNVILNHDGNEKYIQCALLRFNEKGVLTNVKCSTLEEVHHRMLVPEREGYAFVGWALEPNGEPVIKPEKKSVLISGVEYYVMTFEHCLLNNQLYSFAKPNADVFLYAIWEKNR